MSASMQGDHSSSRPPIVLRGAREHNLKGVDLELPRGALIAIGGVSGSGKSSLAFDTLFREGQRRFLESLSTYARHFLGALSRPEVDHLANLSPAIAVDQRSLPRSPRSTVGTVSGGLDVLRLLWARAGVIDEALGVDRDGLQPSRSLFSFNSPLGACERCQGLGVEDRVDPELLVADPRRSIREGALVPTTPKGYVVYSQVTPEVMAQIAAAHGFDLETPWGELTEEQRGVIFFGSERLKVPFGKHSLESRMRWSGITARPREEGYYRGIVPVIQEILGRDRNPNALRFARSAPCSACGGKRLRPEALAVRVVGRDIAEVCALSVTALIAWLESSELGAPALVGPLRAALVERLSFLEELGLGHLALDRGAPTLSAGEARRLRLCAQLTSGLSGLLYVLDEPSAGLHPSETAALLGTLRRLRDQDNTVIVVEHDEACLRLADHLVEIGPGPGASGGEVVAQGAPKTLGVGTLRRVAADPRDLAGGKDGAETLLVRGAFARNLADVDITLQRGRLNVLCGVSGAGKTTLLTEVLAATLGRRLGSLGGKRDAAEGCLDVEGGEAFSRLSVVDDSPIGRTPRSNAATYTKVFDAIRRRFAATEAAKEAGLGASAFSFNTKGGRCESCEGAGVRAVGMHFLPNVEVPCATCGGRRFRPEVLAVKLLGRSIDEVLALSVERAREVFAELPAKQGAPIVRLLEALCEVGLGYISLGQPSTTLSGGEAQRVKLAAELGRPGRGETLYLLDEPTTGLSAVEVGRLLAVFRGLVAEGHTVVVCDHDLDLLANADWLVELGLGSGAAGGRVIAAAPPAELARGSSTTGRALAAWSRGEVEGADEGRGDTTEPASRPQALTLRGVRTHTLAGFDVSFPLGRLSVVTGLSGSGKSSLVFDTLAAEAQRRFTETLSAHARRFMGRLPRAALDASEGLRPAIAIGQAPPARSPRSTVGTMTEIYDYLRLLYARVGRHPESEGPEGQPRRQLHSSDFSFNDERGACRSCGGLGIVKRIDPERLISDATLSLCDGALDGHPRGRFYGERDGQYVATLRAVGEALGIDFERPYGELDERAKAVAMGGAGDEVFSVSWRYKRGKREGEHHFEGPWVGFCALLEEEYGRTHGDSRGEKLEPLLRAETCAACEGYRLIPELLAVRLTAGQGADQRRLHIGELCRLPVDEARRFMENLALDPDAAAIAAQGRGEIQRRLRALSRLGLGYLGLDRAAPTLSAGEARRVRLAAQLGSPLTDVLYALDEPTCGLHPSDSEELLAALRELCQAGNTVVLVDHDPALLRAADHLLELGPGAGPEGGRVVASGTPREVLVAGASLSAAVLADEARPAAVAASRLSRAPRGQLMLRGARRHNLRDLDVNVPLGCLCAVSGVSGSGKSTLVFEVLAESLAAARPVGCVSLSGHEGLSDYRRVDASPIGRTPASMPATYLGLADELRRCFAATDEAKAAGLKAAAFSPNGAAGRCPSCKGLGAQRHSLDFLADVWVPCDVCGGRRFRDEVLQVRWRGHNVAEVYAMAARSALELCADLPKLAAPLKLLEEVGLGYLTLGQWATTLSGGEAQRLKLARELAETASPRKGRGRRGAATAEGGPRLYLLDEPSSGLHPADVERLMGVLEALVERGHSVIVVDHDLGVLARADHIVDLGPGGGPAGGTLVAAGAPLELMAQREASLTGRALAEG